VGMTGPYDGIIGVKKELVLQRFLSGLPARFEAASNDVRLCAVLVECDPHTGRALAIERIQRDANGRREDSRQIQAHNASR